MTHAGTVSPNTSMKNCGNQNVTNNVATNVPKTTPKDLANLALLCFCAAGGSSTALGPGSTSTSFTKNLNTINSAAKMVTCSVRICGGVTSVTNAHPIVNP